MSSDDTSSSPGSPTSDSWMVAGTTTRILLLGNGFPMDPGTGSSPVRHMATPPTVSVAAVSLVDGTSERLPPPRGHFSGEHVPGGEAIFKGTQVILIAAIVLQQHSV